MKPRIAVIADSPDEKWVSMDLVAEMLLREWETNLACEVDAERLSLPIARVARRIHDSHRAWSADRLLGRYVRYPTMALQRRRDFDFFHIADHSYAQMVHASPTARTGVYCHDLDAFRSVLEPETCHRSVAFRAMTHVVLAGLRRAALVFHSTREMGRRLQKLVPGERLVYAPYGISSEYKLESSPDAESESALASLRGAPFILHVGSSIPRKRLDVLFEIFARLHAREPALRLVQQGGVLTDEQKRQLQRLKLDGLVVQPPKLSRKGLAGIYRRASAVLLPSDAEGFGLPVIEALACGTPVVASNLPTTREVGDVGTWFVGVGDVDAWVEATATAMVDAFDIARRRERASHAEKFSWRAHAQIILDAYRSLPARSTS